MQAPTNPIQLSSYINFQGQARAAMVFYHRVLGGTLDLHPSTEGERITQARLDGDGVHIVAVDGHPDYPAKVGETMGLALGGTDQARLTHIFLALAEGGQIKMPLTAQPGGATVGWLTDPFGITWTIQIDPA